MSEQTLQDRLKHEHEYISDLGVTSWTLLDTIRDAAIRIDELERQLAEAQKDQADAKRYKYLRDASTLDTAIWEALEGFGSYTPQGYAKGMDSAIDSAMKVKS